MILAVAAAASQTWSVGNIVTLIAVAITAAGTITVAIVNRKVRGTSDAREDQVAETAMMKSAAEVAMELVDKMKTGSAHVEGTMAQQIESLQKTIDIQKGVIDSLTAQHGADARLAASEIARLQQEVARLTAERDFLQQQLDEFRESVIDEMTLNPAEVRQRAHIGEE